MCLARGLLGPRGPHRVRQHAARSGGDRLQRRIHLPRAGAAEVGPKLPIRRLPSPEAGEDLPRMARQDGQDGILKDPGGNYTYDLPMRPFRVLALAVPLLAAGPSRSAELKPSTYSKLFSRAGVVVSGTVGGVSAGLFSSSREAKIKVEGLYKGRLHANAIEVAWKDEDHRESCFEDGAQVILFLDRRADSSFAQSTPGISCWKVEKIAFGPGRPGQGSILRVPPRPHRRDSQGSHPGVRGGGEVPELPGAQAQALDPGGRAPAAPETGGVPEAGEAPEAQGPLTEPGRRDVRLPLIPGGTAWPPALSPPVPPPGP